ncbi:hypothetical protein C8Q78DRAFT_1083769 [Trametes maxima]|nr:hypothetical protein C8Q78DRAFT_1083769 [Trametes maxima]
MPPTNTTGTTGRSSTPKLRVNTGSEGACRTAAGPTNVHPPSTALHSSSDPTAVAIGDLVGTMQGALKALGSTFRVLGAQTVSVATLGPAVDAVLKLDSLEAVVHAHCLVQDKAVKDEGNDAKERVKDFIRMELRPQIDRIVSEIISKEIEERVRRQLEAQVPQTLKEKLKEYRDMIMASRIELANREARRRNAHIRREAVAEPLRPLLRPQVFPSAAGSDANGNGPGAELKGKKDKDGPKGNKTKQDAHASERSGSSTLLGGPAEEGSAGTPSPLFPKTVHELPSLDAHDARRLLLEYQIPVPADDATEDDGGWEDLGEGEGDDGSKNTKDSSKKAKDGKSTGGRGGQGKGGGPNKSGQQESVKDKSERDKKEKEENERREAKMKAREMRRAADLNAFLQFVGVSSFFWCL